MENTIILLSVIIVSDISFKICKGMITGLRNAGRVC
jgi:hypothetical protein